MTNINGDNSNNLHPLMAVLEKEFEPHAIRLDAVSKHRPLEVCVHSIIGWSLKPMERPVNKWCLPKAGTYGTKEAKLDDHGSSSVSEATLAFKVKNDWLNFMKSHTHPTPLLPISLTMKIHWHDNLKKLRSLLNKRRPLKKMFGRSPPLLFC